MPPRRYLILESDSTSGLRQQVSHHLARGWVTCGGIAVEPVHDPRIPFARYFQAVRLPLKK